MKCGSQEETHPERYRQGESDKGKLADKADRERETEMEETGSESLSDRNREGQAQKALKGCRAGQELKIEGDRLGKVKKGVKDGRVKGKT